MRMADYGSLLPRSCLAGAGSQADESASYAGDSRAPLHCCFARFELRTSDDVFRTFSVRRSQLSPKSLKSWRTREDSNLWPLPSEGSALSS